MIKYKNKNQNRKYIAVFNLIINTKELKINELDTDLFFGFVQEIISKESTGKSKQELESQIKDILGSRKTVLAESFYGVSIILNVDIDILCDNLFKNHDVDILYPIVESDNKLHVFLEPFIIGSTKIASTMGAGNSRLSRLLDGQFKQLYPFEVYSMAKAFKLRPRQLFDYLYGNGKRPRVGA